MIIFSNLSQYDTDTAISVFFDYECTFEQWQSNDAEGVSVNRNQDAESYGSAS